MEKHNMKEQIERLDFLLICPYCKGRRRQENWYSGTWWKRFFVCSDCQKADEYKWNFNSKQIEIVNYEIDLTHAFKMKKS